MESFKDIVEVYKKRKHNEFLIEKRTKIEEIKNKDQVKVAVDKAVENLEKVLADNKITDLVELHFVDGKLDYSSFDFTDATKIAIGEVETNIKDKYDERDRIVEEVRAMEDLCATKEEFEALYKKYGILQEDGKIFDYRK